MKFRDSAQYFSLLCSSDTGPIADGGANDMREVLRRMEAGEAPARLAFDVYCLGCASTSAPTTPRSAARTRLKKRYA